jgi:hypothetical protein
MANSSTKATRGAGSVIGFSANSVRSTGSASLAPRDFFSCQGHFIQLINVRGVNIEDTGNLINGADLLVHSLDNSLSEFEGIRLHAVNLIRLPLFSQTKTTVAARLNIEFVWLPPTMLEIKCDGPPFARAERAPFGKTRV